MPWTCDKGCKDPDAWRCKATPGDPKTAICNCSCHRQPGRFKPPFKSPVKDKLTAPKRG